MNLPRLKIRWEKGIDRITAWSRNIPLSLEYSHVNRPSEDYEARKDLL